MKRWKCTVCGYIHNGDEPPETCPVCGADKSMFILLEDEGQDKATTTETTTAEPSKTSTTRWKCTVCGYIHNGDEPPEKCPVCGADKSAFEQISSEQTQPSKAEAKDASAPTATKWRCTVCGYIHEGEEPPENCPVCGADKSMFEPYASEEPQPQTQPSKSETKESSTQTSASSTSNKRRCTVCGHIHEGDEPPEKCPVCGADKSKFVHFTDAEAGQKAAKDSKLSFLHKFSGPIPPSVAPLTDTLTKYHGHPIAVHIPNGMLPVSVLFAVMAVLFDSASFAIAAKFNTIFVCITMPAVIATGIVDWKNRFGGHITNVFLVKMVCAAIVTLVTLILSIWWIASPETYHGGIGGNFFFLFFYLVDLVAAAVAGWYGGKLVFHE